MSSPISTDPLKDFYYINYRDPEYYANQYERNYEVFMNSVTGHDFVRSSANRLQDSQEQGQIIGGFDNRLKALQARIAGGDTSAIYEYQTLKDLRDEANQAFSSNEKSRHDSYMDMLRR